jgi:glycosyltransferase involved in cell wall biosynthesis
MRYAVDAHAIGRNLTGNEVYIRSLLNAFDTAAPEASFLAYVSGRAAAKSLPRRFETRQIARNPFLRLGFDLPRKLREDRPALLHVQYTSPLRCPVPTVVTVHDVSFLQHPEYFTWWRANQLRITVARSVRQAARVLTISDFARRTIVEAYGLAPNQITVIPAAANPFFRVANRAKAVRRVEEFYGIREPFILTVGDLQPRKNHIRLIGAFARFVSQNPSTPHRLVIAGKNTWYSDRIVEAARRSGMADRISFVGFVPDENLLDLYNACDCFAFPSLYEGFGLPILEAMACGRAVVCSNRASIPEVAGEAGTAFDPTDEQDIANALASILQDPERRARMERLGLNRAAQFTWRKAAEQTLEVYRQVANQPVRIHATA